MSNYITLNETNVEIRKALKAAFPGTKFSVRGSKYAGGASTNVSWVDGPADREVYDFLQQFAGATFDGMTDSKSYVTGVRNGQDVYWGADYVFTSRTISDEVTAALTVEVAGMLGIDPADFRPSAWYDVPDALYQAGMTRSYGSESGALMVRWLAEHRAASPEPRRSNGEWTDEETHLLATRAA